LLRFLSWSYVPEKLLTAKDAKAREGRKEIFGRYFATSSRTSRLKSFSESSRAPAINFLLHGVL
jgi:hypothetical protein